jgi:hypothetical protein
MGHRAILCTALCLAAACIAHALGGEGMTTGDPDRVAVERAVDCFEERRKLLLENTAGPKTTAEQVADPRKDLFGNRAIANLLLGRHAAAANARLRCAAEWFEHPHPAGRDLRGECDFTAMKLCRAWHLFKNTDKLEPATREKIRSFFLTADFQSKYPSENHLLLWRTSRYLMAGEWPDESFKAWGRKGRQLQDEDRAWLDSYIRFRARRGWGEFDSPCYFSPEWECLTGLHDYAPDAELRRLAGMMLDLLLLDMAVDSLNGMYCGAHGRIYTPHALDHSTESTWPLQFLYFGAVDAKAVGSGGTLVDTLASPYRPRRIVLEVALGRKAAYENRERKHLHNTEDVMPARPLDGSVRKYTWWTPQFVMGCVQRQDPYPKDSKGAWYAHHEQHEWDLSFTAGPRARIFTHHPGRDGNEHGYWTGDLRCGCGHFFQNRGALVALYEIPAGQPCQFIHAYLPKDAFDEVVEEKGWVFVRSGKACAALKLLGGQKWTQDNGEWKKLHAWTDRQNWGPCELTSPGGRNGAVCEAGSVSDFGSFAAFRAEIAANRLEFDRQKMRLTYGSKRAGELFIDTRGTRRLDGKNAALDYPTYDCPYLRSGWDSGVVEIISGGRNERLDFREKPSGGK